MSLSPGQGGATGRQGPDDGELTAHPSEVVQLPPTCRPWRDRPPHQRTEILITPTQCIGEGQADRRNPCGPAGQSAAPVGERAAWATRTLRSERRRSQQRVEDRTQQSGVKTERAQAEVDDRRALAEFADSVAGEAFDSAKAATAGERRVQSASRLRETLARALQEIHAMLNPEQRQRLAYLIRSGVLSL